MTNQETIKQISDVIEAYNNLYDKEIDYIKALRRAIAVLEKQEPMEVTEIHCDEYYCPSCGSENMADCYKVGDNYCPRCGQALKTEEEDEDSY